MYFEFRCVIPCVLYPSQNDSYKKAPAGTTVEVVDGTTLPVNGFGTFEVDLDQPDTTPKPVKMVSVACVPGLSRNLLSTRRTVEQ